MALPEFLQHMFKKKEPEVYTPQREAIDRRHDALMRQISFYEKKRQIPMMERKLKEYEQHVYGNTLHTKDDNNILKAPNCFKSQPKQKMRGGMI